MRFIVPLAQCGHVVFTPSRHPRSHRRGERDRVTPGAPGTGEARPIRQMDRAGSVEQERRRSNDSNQAHDT